MPSPVFGEFVGTAVLIVVGEGTNAGVSLAQSKALGAGWLAIATGWAFGVFCGIVTAVACGSPSADLNPAVTLAAAVHNGDFHLLLPFTLAQCAGGFVGATLVWLLFFPHWRVTADPAAKLGVFCTSPAIRSPAWNTFAEALATGVFLLTISAINSHTFALAGPAPGLAPYLVSIVVWGVGLGLGGPTGYAINPARDLAPRLAHTLLPIAGKGPSDWSYAAVPVLGPLLAAVAIGLFLRVTHI